MGGVACISRGAVRVAADERAACALQQAHRPHARHRHSRCTKHGWCAADVPASLSSSRASRCSSQLSRTGVRILAPGEVGTVMIIAADRRQARVIMRYCLGLLKSVPMLAQLIESETRESIALRNRVVIEIHTASVSAVHVGICDLVRVGRRDRLLAHRRGQRRARRRGDQRGAPRHGDHPWRDVAVRIVSPHARKGALWSAYAKHYGKDNDPILVWQAATRDMNGTVPQSYIDAHLDEDAARASAEYLGEVQKRSRSLRLARGGRGLRRRLLRAIAGGGPVVLRICRPGGWLGRRQLRAGDQPPRGQRAWSSTWCASAARRSCRRRSLTSSFRCSSPTASAR